MRTELVLKGFDELKAELAALPQKMKRESEPIELGYARAAQNEIVAAYPSITGDLRAGVKINARTARGVATLLTLVTSDPTAHIYEFGSVHQRPRPTFLPISDRQRRAATVAVADLVKAQGLVVRGERD